MIGRQLELQWSSIIKGVDMNNLVSPIPENKEPASQEADKQIEQPVSLRPSLKTEAPDIQQEQSPSSQSDQAKKALIDPQPKVVDDSVVTNKPVNIDLNYNQVIEDNDDKIMIKDLPWVKKAEKIIEADKDKPYQEEEDSEELQQEYLAKNYGVNVEIDHNNQQPN